MNASPPRRSKATQPSQSAFHRACKERHDTYQVTLSLAERHLIGKQWESAAMAFLTAEDDHERRLYGKRLEAMDVLCDQLELEDGPNRLRAHDAGAPFPLSHEKVAEFIGKQASIQLGKAA